MAIYVSFCPIGLFACDESGQKVGSVLFPKNAEKIAMAMAACREEKISTYEKKLLGLLPKEKIIFEVKKEGYEHQFPNKAGEVLRTNLEKIALEEKFAKSPQELRQLIHEVNLELTKKKMKASFSEDALLIQAASALDELEKNLNLSSMRLREWYGLYWPELEKKIADNERFVKTILEKPEKARISPRISENRKSIGADLEKEDLQKITSFAKTVSALFEERASLKKYIEEKAKALAPNTTAVAGPILTARLLAAAGSLEKLARLPSSTIQILGAEKALFRYLRKKGKAPKYGLLFSHPYVQGAPADKKGKAARLLAAKISLAAKVDFYKGQFIGARLKKELEQEIKKLGKTRPS